MLMPISSLHRTQWNSPIGTLLLASHDAALCGVWFTDQSGIPLWGQTAKPDPTHGVLKAAIDQLAAYFAGQRRDFDLPLDCSFGTPFQQAVWNTLRSIPYGATMSYGAIAQAIGRPRAVRAVGGAVGRNPLGIVLPCHRVLGQQGALTGYTGGLQRKVSLLMWMRLSSLEFGPWTTAGLRVAVAGAVLLPLLLTHERWKLFRRHSGHMVVVGLLNSSIPFSLTAYAVLNMSTGLSAILNATVPLSGALIGWLWMGERPGHRRALGLLIGLFGVALLSWDKTSFQAGGSAWAVLASLAATVSYATATFYARRHLADVPPLTLTAGSHLGATLGLALPAVIYWPAQNPGMLAWVSVLVAGVLPSALGYLLFYRLVERAGPSRTLAVTYLIPVFAMAYGAFMLGEAITLAMVVGGAVVMVGVSLAASAPARPSCTSP
jgi:O-6-methylguanine DNA methyltransferase